MSADGLTWCTVLAHADEQALQEPGSTATWRLRADTPYRFLRIQQNGKNASGQSHYLSLSGFEIYGKVSFNKSIKINVILSLRRRIREGVCFLVFRFLFYT